MPNAVEKDNTVRNIGPGDVWYTYGAALCLTLTDADGLKVFARCTMFTVHRTDPLPEDEVKKLALAEARKDAPEEMANCKLIAFHYQYIRHAARETK